MSDLVATRVQQARLHAKSGRPEKAVELLEQARALAGNDRAKLVQVLRELAKCCVMAGRQDRAAQVAGELATLEPGDKETVEELFPIENGGGMSRRTKIAIVGLVVVLVIAIVIIVWMVAGRQYSPVAVEMPVSPPLSQGSANRPVYTGVGMAPPATVISSPLTGAPQGNTNQSVHQQPAAVLILPSPAAGAGTSGIGSGGGVTAPGASPGQLSTPGSPLHNPFTNSQPVSGPPTTSSPISRENLLKKNVGMLLQVARFQGASGNQIYRVDIPVNGGTCFAVGRKGIMLSNKHVTRFEDDKIPSDCSSLGMPTLTRRSKDMMVCFGSDPGDQYKAEIVYESKRYDLVILKISRDFDQPLAFTDGIIAPTLGQTVFAAGYPAPVTMLLNTINEDESKKRFTGTLSRGTIPLSSWFSPDSFGVTLTSGIISSPSRRLSNVSYVQIDAKITNGNSGGPLLNEKNEVVGIVTLGITGHEGYNFALSVPQLRVEIDPYLKEP